jgi:foldase protein PrsA
MSKVFRLIAGSVTLLLAASLTACAGSGTVVTVNGQAITRAQLDAKLEASPLASSVLHQMVQEALIRQYADQNHIVVSDAEIQAREDQIKTNYPGSQWQEFLAARGLTEQDVHNDLQLNIILEDALGKNVTVSDAQIRQYFNKNHALFDTPDRICASHILVPDLATANKVESQLKPDGSNFAQMAGQYSTDPGSKNKGGSLGCFPRGQMVPAFDQVAFALPVGKISPPVKSQFGWHIILVTSKQPGQRATLASAYTRIKTQLTQQQEQPLLEPFMQSLQQKATIVATDPRYSSLTSTPAPAPVVAPVTSPAAPAATTHP